MRSRSSARASASWSTSSGTGRATPGEPVSAEGHVVNPEVSGLRGDEPEPLADTDLAVVPIDPREVLWAVERMIEL